MHLRHILFSIKTFFFAVGRLIFTTVSHFFCHISILFPTDSLSEIVSFLEKLLFVLKNENQVRRPTLYYSMLIKCPVRTYLFGGDYNHEIITISASHHD